jgi:hypothetical protein
MVKEKRAMPRNYTVVYTHPDGGSATFIYENGELSALAKNLDPQQFWIFKQVKAYLLRNDEDDLQIATRMMAEYGFTAQIMNPLPDLLASPDELAEDDIPPIHYRTLPSYAIRFSPVQTVSEIHWREEDRNKVSEMPPHKRPAVKVPSASQNDYQSTPKPYKPATNSKQTVSQIHWRENDGGEEE